MGTQRPNLDEFEAFQNYSNFDFDSVDSVRYRKACEQKHHHIEGIENIEDLMNTDVDLD
jgi:hypothetical protein